MTPYELIKVTQAIITWSTEAAFEHVAIAKHNSEEPDPEGGMGLWQSFQAEFPKAAYPNDYDFLIAVYSHTFTTVVQNAVKEH